ncbi:MAG: hypothetical protein HOI95_25150 [Chromatiales bacterium]|jgi:hypothetical protein|nr:hypothetical protein [Chromatiales bacterium]
MIRFPQRLRTLGCVPLFITEARALLSWNFPPNWSISDCWGPGLLIVALGWAGVVASASARGPLEPPAPEDFTQVRLAWSKEAYVQPYWEVAKGRSAIFRGFRAAEYDQVLDRSTVWLRKFPIDAPVHWMRAEALKSTGDFAGYARHMYWYRGLMASLHGSGDGRAPGSAIKVVALREEHFLVRDMGGAIAAQDLVDVDGATYHKVRVNFSNGEPITMFFDITIPLAQLERNTFPAPGAEARPGSRPAKIIGSEDTPTAPRKE